MKPLTAQTLLNFLTNLESNVNDLSKVLINYRFDSDSDVNICKFVTEDLFDAKTNNILQSICLVSDASDYL